MVITRTAAHETHVSPWTLRLAAYPQLRDQIAAGMAKQEWFACCTACSKGM